MPVSYQDFTDDEQEYAYITSDNAIASWAELDLAQINVELESLGPDFDVDLLGIKDFEIEPADKYQDKDAEGKNKLSDKFLVPPFSVLNAREGWWQGRKREWLALGIESEKGRDIEPTNISKNAPAYMQGRGNNEGGSIFDPVLCELVYRWFSPLGGTVLDPSASVS